MDFANLRHTVDSVIAVVTLAVPLGRGSFICLQAALDLRSPLDCIALRVWFPPAWTCESPGEAGYYLA